MRTLAIVTREAPAYAAAIGPLPPEVSLLAVESFDRLGDRMADIEALVALPFQLDQRLIDAMPRLRWLQVLTAGVDALDRLELGDTVVSTMAGAQAGPMAELAFLFMLCFARDIRGLLADQAAGAWRPEPRLPLAGSHLVVLGVGATAEALAARAQAFDMRVTGVSDSRTEAPGFDGIVPTARLAEIAGEADYLVVLAPLSNRTRRLVSAEVIGALSPDCVVINLARGAVVDEAALIDALVHGRIRGAGLDVFETEPPRAGNPLWSLPNVLMTPHVAGRSFRFVEQALPILRENVARWFGGGEGVLRNQVSRNAAGQWTQVR